MNFHPMQHGFGFVVLFWTLFLVGKPLALLLAVVMTVMYFSAHVLNIFLYRKSHASARQLKERGQSYALITGASSGIGKDLAKEFAKKGLDLVIVARTEKKLVALKDKIEADYGVDVQVLALDLATADAPQSLMDALESKGLVDKIGVLVNNAGFGGNGLFQDQDEKSVEQMLQLNVTNLTMITRKMLPHLIAKNRGYVMNVSSVFGLLTSPIETVYCATKNYVTAFTLGLEHELASTGVKVCALSPGPTVTEFIEVAGLNESLVFNLPKWPGSDLAMLTRSSSYVAKVGVRDMFRGEVNIVPGVEVQSAIHFTRTWLPSRIALSITEVALSDVPPFLKGWVLPASKKQR